VDSVTVVDLVKVGNFSGRRFISFNICIDSLLYKLQPLLIKNKLNALEDMKDFISLLLHIFFSDVVRDKLVGTHVDILETCISFFEMIKYLFKDINELESNVFNIISGFYNSTVNEVNVIVSRIDECITTKCNNLAIHVEKVYFRDNEFLTGIASIKIETDV